MEKEIETLSPATDLAELSRSSHRSSAPRAVAVDEKKVKETIERIWRLTRRQIEALELELNDPAQSLAERESNARSVAKLSLVMRDLAKRNLPPASDVTFGSDDPRACPRDPEEFKLLLMLELDRDREKENLFLK
jgi:hypothetical protein